MLAMPGGALAAPPIVEPWEFADSGNVCGYDVDIYGSGTNTLHIKNEVVGGYDQPGDFWFYGSAKSKGTVVYTNVNTGTQVVQTYNNTAHDTGVWYDEASQTVTNTFFVTGVVKVQGAKGGPTGMDAGQLTGTHVEFIGDPADPNDNYTISDSFEYVGPGPSVEYCDAFAAAMGD
ncbi:MAG: hypothetical protein WBA46_13450 [Thermomicrobiales bacterium]